MVAVQLTAQPAPFHFTDVSTQSGVSTINHYVEEQFSSTIDRTSGGVAVADVNMDGYPDFFAVTRGESGGELWINQRDGSFEPAPDNGGITGPAGSTGPLFFYFDGDAYPDLFIGSVSGASASLHRGHGDGTFTPVSIPAWEWIEGLNATGATAVDFDRDGWQDLFICRWNEPFTPFHFYRNTEGNGFEAYDEELGYYNVFPTAPDHGFTANFRDLTGNGYPDLLLSGDFGTTQLWLNDSGRAFTPTPTDLFTDENGMGGTVGDFDNDGDEDWFVSSISDQDGTLEGNWGGSGNRLYRNNGDGFFAPYSLPSRAGGTGWGWGCTFGDLNHDGWLDLIVTNGWPRSDDSFKGDTTRLFAGEADQPFSVIGDFPLDTLQGRGISLLDIEKDGDLDVLISNYNGGVRLFRNDCDTDNWLTVTPQLNERTALGAVVKLYTSSGAYRRTVGESSNYISQNFAVAHFGFPATTSIDSAIINWPTGIKTTYLGLTPGREYILSPATPLALRGETALPFPNPVEAGQTVSIPVRTTSPSPLMYIWSPDGKLIGSARLESHQETIAVYRIPTSETIPAGMYYISPSKMYFNQTLSPIKLIIR